MVAAAALPVLLLLFWVDELDEALVHDIRERFVGHFSVQPHEMNGDEVRELRQSYDALHVPGALVATPSTTDSSVSLVEFVRTAQDVATWPIGKKHGLTELYSFLRTRCGERRAPAALWRSAHMQDATDFTRLCAGREGLCVVLFAASESAAPWRLLGAALRGFEPRFEAFTFVWTLSYTPFHAELNVALPSSPAIAVIEPRRKKVATLAVQSASAYVGAEGDLVGDASALRRWLAKFDVAPGEYADAFYADVPPFASPLQMAAPASIRGDEL
jgi:hypothetical protein